jgi:hypothetical protein
VVVFIFGLRNPMLAGLEIIVLWLMIMKPTFTLLKLINWLFIFTLSSLGKFRSCVEWKYLVVE